MKYEKDSVTVVLSGYKRPEFLREQITSIENQSVKVDEILFWRNYHDNMNFDSDLINKCKSSLSNYNFGVWSRFTYSLNAKSEYVCIIDDDTIPGNRWIENCLNSFKQKPGLYGTIGLRFSDSTTYLGANRYGWDGINNEEIVEVDIVGHSWFFKKIWLENFWSEYSNKFPNNLAGEDIHFSYVIQKYLGLPTLVPKHPKNQPEFWGSLPKFAKELGQDKNSISTDPKSLVKFEKALQHYRKLGFVTKSEKSNKNSRYPTVIYWLIQKFPRTLHRIIKLRNKLNTF